MSELLLQVGRRVNEDYLEYYDLLTDEERAGGDWLELQLLPSLLLLPQAVRGAADYKAVNLAAMIELAYLAQSVHNRTPKKGSGEDYRLQILIGDYLFAAAIKGLNREGQCEWLERMGGVICRMNEGRTTREAWQERSYVPLDEKTENLQKEYGELSALAGIIGAASAGLSQEASQAYTAFAFYAGIIQGIFLNGYHEEQAGIAELYLGYCEQYLLSLPTELARAAEGLLRRFPSTEPKKQPAAAFFGGA